MDSHQFDWMTRSLMAATPRRAALGLIVGGALLLAGRAESDAKKKKKKKKKNKNPQTTPTPLPAGPIAYADATCGATGIGSDGVRLAQTFRALRSGQLTSATVFLTGSSGGHALDMEIWSVDGAGKPAAVLAGTTVTNLPATTGTSHPITATFAGPASVVAGLRYALVTASTNGFNYRLAGASGDLCPDGQAFVATSSAGALTAQGAFDFQLQTVVTA